MVELLGPFSFIMQLLLKILTINVARELMYIYQYAAGHYRGQLNMAASEYYRYVVISYQSLASLIYAFQGAILLVTKTKIVINFMMS